MKNINPYLVAFYAVLVKSLVLGFGYPEVAAMAVILCKLAHDAHIESKKAVLVIQDKQKEAEAEKRLKDLEDKIASHSNSLKFLNQVKR